jgi:hypothetical protein
MDPKINTEVSSPKLPTSRYAIASFIIYLILLPSSQAPLIYKIILYLIVILLAIKALIDVKNKKVRGKILSIIVIVFASINFIFSILLALK